MRSKAPIPRSPRNIIRSVSSTKKRFLDGIPSAVGVMVGYLLSTLITFVSQGPESVRRIPEIPAAVAETAAKTWGEYRIARALSRTWEYLPPQAAHASQTSPVRITLQSDGNRLMGELYSPAVRVWTIYEMALVEGRRDGAVLHLTVFDFVYGERKEFAKIDVLYQEQPTDGITDHLPALVLDEILAKTTWQIGGALPPEFTLRMVER